METLTDCHVLIAVCNDNWQVIIIIRRLGGSEKWLIETTLDASENDCNGKMLRAAKMLFDKCCTCEGTGRGCALNGIKAICSDFETGLWRPFLEELHKHQSD